MAAVWDFAGGEDELEEEVRGVQSDFVSTIVVIVPVYPHLQSCLRCGRHRPTTSSFFTSLHYSRYHPQWCRHPCLHYYGRHSRLSTSSPMSLLWSSSPPDDHIFTSLFIIVAIIPSVHFLTPVFTMVIIIPVNPHLHHCLHYYVLIILVYFCHVVTSCPHGNCHCNNCLKVPILVSAESSGGSIWYTT